jgi:hypothetical protein
MTVGLVGVPEACKAAERSGGRAGILVRPAGR